MTPGARLQGVIDVLTSLDAATTPADELLNAYLRKRRFIGAKDRAAIVELFYGVLRRRAAIDWYIIRGGQVPTPRLRVLTGVLLLEDWTLDAVSRCCDGDRYRPVGLLPSEHDLLATIEGKSLEHRDMPGPVRANYPDWLDETLRRVFGDRLPAEMAALNANAPLDLRVNQLKGSRAEARQSLEADGVEAFPTPFAPTGLRIHGRVQLGALDSFKSGRIEVQDEGSQLAALLAQARPGMRVVDFCAGAGGKTLALAAQMQNKGHLVACDVSEKRLERSSDRLKRAGISNVERRTLTTERDKWVKRHAETFDRVFIDAPCTGTGTWRRNPDAKWRLTEATLADLTRLQARILDSAARLVKPGGRLVYVTCSLLPAENDEQITAFLAGHDDFAVVPVPEIWREAFGKPCPETTDLLHLTPARHNTDGFFVAVLERRAAVAPAEATEAA